MEPGVNFENILDRVWWEDAACSTLARWEDPHLCFNNLTSGAFELFCNPKTDVSRLRPFGYLAYVHLQKSPSSTRPHAS